MNAEPPPGRRHIDDPIDLAKEAKRSPQMRTQVFDQLIGRVRENGVHNIDNVLRFGAAAKELGRKEGYSLIKAIEANTHGVEPEEVKVAADNFKREIVMDTIAPLVMGELRDQGYEAGITWQDDNNRKRSPLSADFNDTSGHAARIVVSTNGDNVDVVYQQEQRMGGLESLGSGYLDDVDLEIFNKVFDTVDEIDEAVRPILVDHNVVFTNEAKLPQPDKSSPSPQNPETILADAIAKALPGTNMSDKTVTEVYDWKDFYTRDRRQKDLKGLWPQRRVVKTAKAKTFN